MSALHYSEHESLSVKTQQHIADEYGISSRTLRRWIRKEGLNIPQGVLKPIHQKLIYDTFGYPLPVSKKQGSFCY